MACLRCGLPRALQHRFALRRRLAVFNLVAAVMCIAGVAFVSNLTVRAFAHALSLPPLKHCAHCAFAPYVASNSLTFRVRFPLAYCACCSLGLVADLHIKLCR